MAMIGETTTSAVYCSDIVVVTIVVDFEPSVVPVVEIEELCVVNDADVSVVSLVVNIDDPMVVEV